MENILTRNWLYRLLPYLLVFTGIAVCFTGWLIFQSYFNQHAATTEFLPLSILFLGIAIAVLLAAIIRISQLSRQLMSLLNKANQNFQNEVNDRIHAEETKKKLEIALLQGHKLQAIGTLASGIAHDFNNVLYAIKGYVGLAREDVPAGSKTHANLGKVLEAAERGQELIVSILAFSRRQHHEFSLLDLNEVIEAALSLLRPTIPSSIIINFKSEARCMISANQTQLHQVLVNIINNAVDAMNREGIITLRVSRVEANDACLAALPDIIPTQNYCKIEIMDRGQGMDQSTMDRIFEPFFTTKEVGKGTGLGLSIAHSIMKEHNGNIMVSSQIGQGTTFTLILPEQTAYKETENG